MEFHKTLRSPGNSLADLAWAYTSHRLILVIEVQAWAYTSHRGPSMGLY